MKVSSVVFSVMEKLRLHGVDFTKDNETIKTCLAAPSQGFLHGIVNPTTSRHRN